MRTEAWGLVLFGALMAIGLLTSGATVGAEQATGPQHKERTGDGAVGASISHPEGWILQREAYTFDKPGPTTSGRARSMLS